MPPEANAVEQVLASLGKMIWESYVKSRQPLLNLPEELLQALEEDIIEYIKDRAIAGIKEVSKRKSLLKEAIAQGLSLNQIKEKIAKLKAAAAKGKGGTIDKTLMCPQRLK
ncbi:MAG: hypothetical protein V7K89_18315 [Nostoc sp.]|uniref:hypothetical protein n=1 Tax=Nostoc sp. TaxID=1180 RepID=UPI002FF8489C